jgi:hypothetical protein
MTAPQANANTGRHMRRVFCDGQRKGFLKMITGQKIISLLKKMLQSPVLRSAAPYLGFFVMTAFFLCIFARIGGQNNLGPEPGSSGSSPPLTEAAESNLENDYFLNVLLLTSRFSIVFKS